MAGAALAAELGVSLRQLYRDVATLRADGAPIEAAAGLGFVLRPGWTLPPPMLTEDEVEALALGMAWVGRHGDPGLARAARDALAKVEAVLAPPLRARVENAPLLVGPSADGSDDAVLAPLREAIRAERKVRLAHDGPSGAGERTVWPLAVGFFEGARVLVAWCERREGFRHFRLDRMRTLAFLDARLPARRDVLLAQWRHAEGIGAS